jgi:6-phosphofructokinase 1
VILIPEMPVDQAQLLARVQETVERIGTCCIVVADTAVDGTGAPLAAAAGEGSVGDRLAELIGNEIGFSATVHRSGRMPYCAGFTASQTDLEEAYDCGRNAVLSAINGQSAFVVKLVRQSNDPYRCSIGLTQFSEVVSGANPIPPEWLDAGKMLPNEAFLHYIRPLVQGEPEIPMPGGLPAYAQLAKVSVDLDADAEADAEPEPEPAAP